MQLHISRKDSIRRVPLPAGDAPSIIGRSAEGFMPDIDLTPNLSVSRRHAKIWQEAGAYWIEDLGSRVGTLVDGVQIKGAGRQPLPPGAPVTIGKTILRLEPDPPSEAPASASPPAADSTTCAGAETEEIKFSMELLSGLVLPESSDVAAGLLGAIQELTTMFGRLDPPQRIARALMLRMRELVKVADHVALLLLDERTADLALAAHEPEGDPRGSTTLARLAIERGQAIVWVRARHGAPQGLANSIADQQLENVLCAPLIWQGKALGALWLSGSGARSFSRTDLCVAAALAQHAAIALSGHRLREELAHSAATLKRIMAHFSPRVATRLLEQASHGRLRPGGVQSHVTLLCCDLRGFTMTTAGMSADDVVDMLNEYFADLVAVLLRHGGTVDKFMGDAILAIFGSPEADPEQHGNAVAAALEMQKSMQRINALRIARGVPALELGIGVHCGMVLHGFIGSEQRVEFTVIGDAVNKTSRYTEGAGPGEIVISPDLHQLVWKKVKARRTEIHTRHEGNLPAFVLQEK